MYVMKNIDVTELPESELEKSSTYRELKDDSGICRRCKEHTSVLYSCCGAPVHYNGGNVDPDYAWDLIEQELEQEAKDHAEDIAEAAATGN